MQNARITPANVLAVNKDGAGTDLTSVLSLLLKAGLCGANTR
jgi:hypothetical protein